MTSSRRAPKTPKIVNLYSHKDFYFARHSLCKKILLKTITFGEWSLYEGVFKAAACPRQPFLSVPKSDGLTVV